MVDPGAPSAPQQSASFEQMESVTRQPDSGWQTGTPVGPYGAHDLLQHLPPQTAGGDASAQTVPPTSQEALEGRAQMPSAFPGAFVQTPPQHSEAVLQMSLFCTQNDGFEQTPLLQNFDAQSPGTAHGLPDVAGPPGFSGAHLPPPRPSGAHLPPQHSGSAPHA